MLDFVRFAASVLKGLQKAVATDIDVFLLLLAGLLLGKTGLGKALLVYVVARRADQYAGLLASKLDHIALVMAKEEKTNE